MSTLPTKAGVFITGTDTGVGKTIVGCGLVCLLATAGFQPRVRKPVESGCHERDGILWPSDGADLSHCAGHLETLQTVTPYRLQHALSPARAARLEGIKLSMQELIFAVENEEVGLKPDTQAKDFRVVEGAGGFYSPLCEDGLNADFAQQLGLPVILVAPDRLGVINHVLLSHEAINRRGLKLLCVVLNATQAPSAAEIGMNNYEDLKEYIATPIIRYPYISDGSHQADALLPLLNLLQTL